MADEERGIETGFVKNGSKRECMENKTATMINLNWWFQEERDSMTTVSWCPQC